MSIDLQPLLKSAFYKEEEVQNASEAIERLLESYEKQKHAGARPFETVAPSDPDEQWVREGLLHRLIYYCDSEGAGVPECAGVIVAMYVGSSLYGILARRVIEWASGLLNTPPEKLRELYGTHEVETARR
ncbi:MAG TPA: STAUR_1299 family protein [Kofleriaceae bacterium]|nr:STAUR_1299 family protein [Kofleriaceae bacterium]